MYNKILLLLLLFLAFGEVNITAPSSSVLVGSDTNLTCIVTLINSSLSPPTMITWLGPDGRVPAAPILVVTVDTITTATLQLKRVRSSQTGTYTCIVSLNNGETTTITEDINLTGKYFIKYMCRLIKGFLGKIFIFIHVKLHVQK